MNVTTKRSDCDPKQRIRQLEFAIEHAKTAAIAAMSSKPSRISIGTVEVGYPSFEFRKTLKIVEPNAGTNGIWTVIDLGKEATVDACKAACTVLQHYYPDEHFVVGTVPVSLAS